MTATVHPIKPNSRTYERLRCRRQEARNRIVARIGIDRTNGSLVDEGLLAWAMAIHTWDKTIGLAR